MLFVSFGVLYLNPKNWLSVKEKVKRKVMPFISYAWTIYISMCLYRFVTGFWVSQGPDKNILILLDKKGLKV